MGKHVFVEKPFTSTVDEAIELNELAKEMKLKIHVDHIMIYHPAIKKIKELIIDNEIGDILYFDCKRTNANQIRSDLSVMWDLAVHDLSIIDYLMDGKEPDNINVMGRKYFGSKENLSFLNISYPRFVSHLQSSSISHHKERKLTIVGKKKTLIFDDLKEDDKLKVYDKNTNLILGKKINYYSQKFEQHNALYNSIENFRKIIDLNKQSVSGPDQAIRIQKILEKADKLMNNK
jgi:predicted dehydrogenase